MTGNRKIGIIILAAGASSRLGRPKQLVKFRKKFLLQHMIDLSDSFDFDSEVLVLGANEEEIKNQVQIKNFRLVHNENWEEGIASSIRKGVEESLRLENELDHILILLSDQPLIDRKHIGNLIQKQSENESLATFSKYDQNVGVPAIFSKEIFLDLQNLKGDQGAKKLIYGQDFKYQTVSFEKGNFDVDTQEDVEKLKELEDK